MAFSPDLSIPVSIKNPETRQVATAILALLKQIVAGINNTSSTGSAPVPAVTSGLQTATVGSADAVFSIGPCTIYSIFVRAASGAPFTTITDDASGKMILETTPATLGTQYTFPAGLSVAGTVTVHPAGTSGQIVAVLIAYTPA